MDFVETVPVAPQAPKRKWWDFLNYRSVAKGKVLLSDPPVILILQEVIIETGRYKLRKFSWSRNQNLARVPLGLPVHYF